MTMPRYKTIRKKAFVTPAKTRQTVARRTRQEMQAKAGAKGVGVAVDQAGPTSFLSFKRGC